MILLMKTTSLADVRTQLSKYVDEVVDTHEQVTITRNGRPAAVLISADDFESLHETLFWLSQNRPAEDEPAVPAAEGLQDLLARAEADGDTRAANKMRALISKQ
jgi:antitoxin YefM